MHILSPETDNCPSWISGRERMTVENISWSISTKECCRPGGGGFEPATSWSPVGRASNWATETGQYYCKYKITLYGWRPTEVQELRPFSLTITYFGICVASVNEKWYFTIPLARSCTRTNGQTIAQKVCKVQSKTICKHCYWWREIGALFRNS